MTKKPPYTEDEAAATHNNGATLPPLDPPDKSKAKGKGNGNGRKPGSGGAKHYAMNDGGNGQRLLDLHGNDLRFIKETDYWIAWDNEVWGEDRTWATVEGKAQEVARGMWAALGMAGIPRTQLSDMAKWTLSCGNASKVHAAAWSASRNDDFQIKLAQLDTHDWLVPCANGFTYDLQAGVLRPSRREDYMTLTIGVAASEKRVPHPMWDAFLRLIMANDEEMVHYLRLILGSCLTGSVKDQTFHIWHGEKDNGKSTLLKFLARLLGGYAFKVPLRALLAQRGGSGILHDLADMRGKRLVYTEEFKAGDTLEENTIKNLTGGGDITGDRKGENNITFRSTGKLILATNNLPELRDVGAAMAKRLRVIPFPVNIPAYLAERGLPLRDQEVVIGELMEEAPGILQDLVGAAQEWMTTMRVPMPKPVADLTEQYLVEQDPLKTWMQTCCTTDGQREERPYSEWFWSFIEQSGRDTRYVTPQWFGRQLRAKGFAKREAVNGKFYTGPALTDAAARAMCETKARHAGDWEGEDGATWPKTRRTEPLFR